MELDAALHTGDCINLGQEIMNSYRETAPNVGIIHWVQLGSILRNPGGHD